MGHQAANWLERPEREEEERRREGDDVRYRLHLALAGRGWKLRYLPRPPKRWMTRAFFAAGADAGAGPAP